MIEPTYEPFHVERVDRVRGNETAILLEGVHQVEQAYRSGLLVCPVAVTRSTSNVNLERSKIRLELINGKGRTTESSTKYDIEAENLFG